MLETRSYHDQLRSWPTTGRHILAQYDDDSVIVYQAYRPAIAEFAVRHQRFGGEFKLTRMSWIKPNFLWMMYRCGWASKEGQERVLAVRLHREFFDRVLRLAVPSGFHRGRYASEADWKKALQSSEVRLQWDPDHDPSGAKVERRAIQLGLRGRVLEEYAHEALIEVLDVSEFVRQQSDHAHPPYRDLEMPAERVYRPEDEETAILLGLDDPAAGQAPSQTRRALSP